MIIYLFRLNTHVRISFHIKILDQSDVFCSTLKIYICSGKFKILNSTIRDLVPQIKLSCQVLNYPEQIYIFNSDQLM